MADQPDFDLLSQCFQTISVQMKLMGNILPQNDQQEAHRRHQEIMQELKRLNTRLNCLKIVMDRFTIRMEDVNLGIERLTANMDGIARTLDTLTTNVKDLTSSMDDLNLEVLTGSRDLKNKAILQDQNSIARSLNSPMTGRPRLRYIDPRTGAGLDFFPDSIEAVNKLDEDQLNCLLDVFGLSKIGTMDNRRSRFIKRIQVGYMV